MFKESIIFSFNSKSLFKSFFVLSRLKLATIKDGQRYLNIDIIKGVSLVLWDAVISDIKLLLDLVPNHSSDRHTWFQKSVRGVPPYDEYYVWHSGSMDYNTGSRVPPTNWVSEMESFVTGRSLLLGE